MSSSDPLIPGLETSLAVQWLVKKMLSKSNTGYLRLIQHARATFLLPCAQNPALLVHMISVIVHKFDDTDQENHKQSL